MANVKNASENPDAGLVEAGNLAIEDSVFDSKMLRDPCGEIRKAVENVSVSRDEFAFTVLEVCESAEAVYLQLIDELIGVERFGTA